MSKVYCRYCGKQIDEDATFCTHCGKEQNVSKKPLWNVDGLRSSSKTIVQKALALVRIPIDYVKTIKIPRMNAAQANLWRKRMKRVGKVVLALAVVAVVITAGAWVYSYYYYKYLPEKRLDEACADVLSKMRSSNKTVSIEYCRKVLLNQWAFDGNAETWGYGDVSDNKITDRMSQYRNEAFRTIESEAYNGNPDCQYLLGRIYIGRIAHQYRTGRGTICDMEYSIEPDTVKAIYWWNEAAKQKYILAYNKMGYSYEKGIGVRQDIKKAIEYYKSGAEAGEAYAQANYGRLFRDGVKVKVGSHKETKRYTGYGWYRSGEKIREYYDPNLMEFITITKEDVDDYEWLIPKDIEQAKFWWQKAAAQGNQYAKDFLQQVYE